MKIFIFFILLFESFAQERVPEQETTSTPTEGGTPVIDCVENCPDGNLSNQLREIGRVANTANTCPEQVKQIKLLMASSYGTCDAMEELFSADKMVDRVYSIEGGNGNRRMHLVNGKPCTYGGGNNCADISKLENALTNHPYNSLQPKCEEVPKCEIGGEEKPCPSFFFMGRGRNPDNGPYKQRGQLDPSKSNYLNRDINGNEFMGWNCSEYVATAMALAGQKIKCDKTLSQGWWNVQKFSEAADDSGSCSCMDVVDLSDPNEKIKAGDVLLFGGHAMMVESSSDPDFMGKFSNPRLAKCNGENRGLCVNEIKRKCSENRIGMDSLNFRINHASDSFGGIGASKMNYSDYEQATAFQNNFISINNFQRVRQKVETYFEETKGFENLPNSGLSESAYNLWMEGKMTTKTFFEVFLKDKISEVGLNEREVLAYRHIDQVMTAFKTEYDSKDSSNNMTYSAYRLWLSGKMNTDDFNRAFLKNKGLGESWSSAGWSKKRKYVSELCVSRACKRKNLTNAQFCKDVQMALDSKIQSTKEDRFFKVIRHNSENEACIDNNPPKLKNSCGDTCDQKANQGCVY